MPNEDLACIVYQAVYGATTGGGSRQVVASAVAAAIRSFQPLAPPGDAHLGGDILQAARTAADDLLNSLPHWASLDGPATKSFGTTLRAAPVRRSLSEIRTEKGKLPLLRELEYRKSC